VNFKIDTAKNLYYLNNTIWDEVELKSCFPISSENSMYSVLNKEGAEVLLIDDIKSMDDQDKKIIEEYFTFKKFRFLIKGFYSVEDNFGIRQFDVLTQVGQRTFQTELDSWPKIFEDKILITDIYGDQYWVEDLEFGDKLLKSLV
jgi:hypothetical protein